MDASGRHDYRAPRSGPSRVDAHRRCDARKDSIDEASVVATDVEEAITMANEGDRHMDPPTLEQAIERLHAGGPDPRRRMPNML